MSGAKRSDLSIGLYLSVEIERAQVQITTLNRRIEILNDMRSALKICPVCAGMGTTELRGGDERRDCPGCGGRGHNRL